MNAEELAEKFHKTYQKLSPEFYGVNINKVSWEETSNENKLLMAAVFREIKRDLVSKDVAKKVLRLAMARGRLMIEVLRSAEEFGYGVIVKKIKEDGCMKKWIKHEKKLKELKEETDGQR